MLFACMLTLSVITTSILKTFKLATCRRSLVSSNPKRNWGDSECLRTPLALRRNEWLSEVRRTHGVIIVFADMAQLEIHGSTNILQLHRSHSLRFHENAGLFTAVQLEYPRTTFNAAQLASVFHTISHVTRNNRCRQPSVAVIDLLHN